MGTPRYPTHARSLHVLVVDDDPTILERARERLEGEGHRVTVETSATSIESVIRVLRPDLVLIDVMMPGLSGKTLSRLLDRCATGRSTSIILHSSIPTRALRYALDVSRALGVIQKTENDVEFFFAFSALVDKMPAPALRPFDAVSPMSGTHRILDDEITEEDDEITQRWFPRTSPGMR